MTLSELIDTTLDEVGYSTLTAPGDVRLRLRRRINEWHRRLLSQPGLSRFLRDTFTVTFASVSGTPTYGLPSTVGRLVHVRETTNDVLLEQRSLTWLRATDPGLTASGTPEAYVPLGISPVQTQPADASTCVVVSSSASDTTQKATLVYLDSSHVTQTAVVTLNGTTAVNIGTTVLEILSFHVTPSRVGTVTLREDTAAGTILATVPVGSGSSRYLRIQLWPTPTAAVTYQVDATRESAELVSDTEEPLLPRDFHYLLYLGAVADELRSRDDTRYEAVRQDMQRGIADLKAWMWNNADYQPSGRSPGTASRLGGWFPAGS